MITLILLYWLFCIHSYFHCFLHNVCQNPVLTPFSLGLHNCIEVHLCLHVSHLWTLEKWHRKSLWKAVLNIKKIFSKKLYNPIYHFTDVWQKVLFQEASPFQEMFQKIEVHKNQKSRSHGNCKPDSSAVYIKASQRSVPLPRVTEKKIWSLLTMLLGHSFWINFQMPWMVTLMIYSIFFSEERYHSKGMWGLSSAASEITALEIMKVGEHCN